MSLLARTPRMRAVRWVLKICCCSDFADDEERDPDTKNLVLTQFEKVCRAALAPAAYRAL